MNNFACNECLAIAQELHAAYHEMFSDHELRDAWLAGNKLMGGTDEDVLRAEELFPKSQIKSSPRIGIAIKRKLTHEALTGHRLPKPINQK